MPKGRIRFELTDKPIRPELSAFERTACFEVRNVSVDGQSTSMFKSWVTGSGSPPSIFVAVPMPYGGYSLEVHREGRNLVGTFSTSTDAILPDGESSVSRPIRALRIACESGA